MTESTKDILAAKLDQLINLMGYEILLSDSTDAARIVVLDRLGLDAKQIAQIWDTTANVVYARLSKDKKGKASKKPKKARKGGK